MEKKTKFALKPLISLLALAVAAPVAYAGDGNKKQGKDQGMERAIRLTTLEGMEVTNRDGESVGSVDDVVINPQTGEIEALLIGTGLFGIGGPEKKVDLADVDKSKIRENRLQLNISSDDLERIEDFDRSKYESASASQQGGQSDPILALNYRDEDVVDTDSGHRGEVHDWIVDVDDARAPFLIVRQLPGAPSDVRWDYYAVSTDHVVGDREGELVIDIEEGAFMDAEMVDTETLQRVDDLGAVYQFRYDASELYGSTDNRSSNINR